jgi:hypothetical protein
MPKKLKIVIYLATQWIHGVGGVGIVVLCQGLSVGTVTVATVVLGWHSGVQTTCIDCSLLVAVDVIQPIIIIPFLVSAVICQPIRIIPGYKGE